MASDSWIVALAFTGALVYLIWLYWSYKKFERMECLGRALGLKN